MVLKGALILLLWNEQPHLTSYSPRDQQKHFRQNQKGEKENGAALNRSPHFGAVVDQLQTFNTFLILDK
jgi:hypothetical protein